MKRRARSHPESDSHVLCPVCETPCEKDAALAACTGCGTRWTIDADGDAVFDDERRADRQETVEAAAADRAKPRTGLQGAARRRPVRLRKKPRR